MFCGSGSQLYRQQAPVIKATAKAKKATKTSREKRQRTSTCAAVIHHPGWPRVTWYGMPSHFVPWSQSWGVTTGTFFQGKKREQTHKKKADGPRRWQAIKIACHPDHKRIRRNTLLSHFEKQHVCPEASKV